MKNFPDTFLEKYGSKRNRIIIAALASVGIFGIMLIFNLMTPLLADDFDYLYIFNNSLENSTQRVSSFSDIFVSLKDHYQWVNGRLVDHFFAQAMLLLGRTVFSVINSALYLGLGALIYFTANGKEKFRLSLFVLVELLMFYSYTVWGETFLWLTGSCNYLWPTVIALAYLLPFRFHLESDGKSKSKTSEALLCVPMLLCGFAAGWTNENLSPAVIVSVVYFLILFKSYKLRLPLWGFAGLVGNVAGFLPLLLCPALAIGGDGLSFFEKIVFAVSNIDYITGETRNYLVPLLAACAALFFLSERAKKLTDKCTQLSFIYILFALVALYVCALAKDIESRNLFFSTTALIVVIATLFTRLDFSVKTIKQMAVGAFAVMLLVLPFDLKAAYSDIHTLDYLWQERETYIAEQKESGNNALTFKIFEPETKYSPVFELRDFVRGDYEWPNTSIAKYYSLESIKAYKAADRVIYSYGDTWESTDAPQ